MDKSTNDVRLTRWLSILEECAASGMSKKDWCKEHNIDLKKFYYWQRKARATLASTELVVSENKSSPTFVKLPAISNTQPLPISFTADMVISFNVVTIGIANTASTELLSLIGAITNAKWI